MSDTYPTDRRNRLRQLKEKGSYDRTSVHAVLDAGLVAHAAFCQDGAPVVVPMIYGREGDTLYLHGARKARVIRMLETTEQACVNVTLVDALVLARSAFNSSMNYRSVTVFGRPRLIEGTDEKLAAMKVISEHLMPGRWDELRAPHDREVKMTGVLEMPFDSASAKISDKMPDDEPEDYGIPVWAGLVAVTTALGEPRDDGRLQPGVEPSTAVLALPGRKL